MDIRLPLKLLDPRDSATSRSVFFSLSDVGFGAVQEAARVFQSYKPCEHLFTTSVRAAYTALKTLAIFSA